MSAPRSTMNLGRALLQAGGLDKSDGALAGVVVNRDNQSVMLSWNASLTPETMNGQRAGIDSVTSTTGQPFAFKSAGSFVQLMRPRLGALGLARLINMPGTGLLSFPQQTGTDVTASWRPENPPSPLTPNQITTALADTKARTVQFGLVFSRQFLFSSAHDYDGGQELISLLASAAAAAVGTAAIQGVGSGSDQPLGLLNVSGVPTVPIGTNGGPLSITECALLEEQLGNANADVGALAFHTTVAARRKSRTVEGFTGNGPLWTDRNTLIGYPAYASTNTPSNLTKGTASGICSAALFGNWLDFLLITFGPGVDIVIDPYSEKNRGMIELSLTMYVDSAPVRASSFAKCLDVVTT